MTRDLDAGVQQAIDDADTDGLNMALLFFADYEDDPVYVWTGIGDLEHNGNTYLGVGDLGNISSIIEDSKLKDVRYSATLSSIPQGSIPDIISAVTDGNPTGRDFTIDLAFFTPDVQLVGVLPLTAGFMDGSQINESPTEDGGFIGSITQNLASDATRLSKRKFIRQTNQAQQQLFPSDLGFEFVSDTNMGEIYWGQKASVVAGQSTGDRGGGGNRRGRRIDL
jgi:hypothetical protein